jgi:hypothetical protein
MTNGNELTTINTAQQTILTQTTPPNVVKTRKGRGGKTLSYVSHDYVTRTLNEAFNFAWSFDILSERFIGGDNPSEVVVKGQLTVHGPNGDLTKTQFGGSDVKRLKNGNTISIADDLKSAASDALKKCASLLGVALDLYGNTPPAAADPQPAQAQPRQPTNGNRSPKAQLFNRLVSECNTTVQNIADILMDLQYEPGVNITTELAEEMYTEVRNYLSSEIPF